MRPAPVAAADSVHGELVGIVAAWKKGWSVRHQRLCFLGSGGGRRGLCARRWAAWCGGASGGGGVSSSFWESWPWTSLGALAVNLRECVLVAALVPVYGTAKGSIYSLWLSFVCTCLEPGRVKADICHWLWPYKSWPSRQSGNLKCHKPTDLWQTANSLRNATPSMLYITERPSSHILLYGCDPILLVCSLNYQNYMVLQEKAAGLAGLHRIEPFLTPCHCRRPSPAPPCGRLT